MSNINNNNNNNNNNIYIYTVYITINNNNNNPPRMKHGWNISAMMFPPRPASESAGRRRWPCAARAPRGSWAGGALGCWSHVECVCYPLVN
jgi:hypothetical protein